MSPTNLHVHVPLGNIMPACYESKIIMPMKTFIASESKEKENQNVWQNSWRVAPKNFWFSPLEKRCITKYYANQLSFNCYLPANLPLKRSYQNGLRMTMRGVARSCNSHDKRYFSYTCIIEPVVYEFECLIKAASIIVIALELVCNRNTSTWNCQIWKWATQILGMSRSGSKT